MQIKIENFLTEVYELLIFVCAKYTALVLCKCVAYVADKY